MTIDEIIEALKAVIPDVQVEAVTSVDQPTIVVPREQMIAVCTALRDTPSLRFTCLDLTAVDWWPGEPRFQMVYHLASFERVQRLRLKVLVPGEDAHVPTISTQLCPPLHQPGRPLAL